MGCGKTTHGKKLAKSLGYNFIDLDELISQHENLSISKIFELKGEKEFRAIETHTIQNLINLSANMVIALGGGTPCYNNNLDLLKKHGMVIYIQMTPNALYNRLIHAKEKRPLLKNKSETELLSYIEDLLQQREHYYRQADITIEGLSLETSHLKEQILSFQSGA